MNRSYRAVILWGGLVVAFLPVIHDVAMSLHNNAGQRYVLLSVLLIGLLILRNSDSRFGNERPGIGVTLLVLGLAAQLIGIASGSWSIARVGLPVAMLGISLVTGKPDTKVVVLAFAAVPIPGLVFNATSPWLESILAVAAAKTLALAGIQLDVGGPLLQFDGARFEMLASDNGIVTAVLLGEVGWYFAIRAHRSFGQAAWQAICWALLAIVIQPLLVLLCIATLPLGVPHLGRFFLTFGVAILLVIIVLVVALLSRSSRSVAYSRDRRLNGG